MINTDITNIENKLGVDKLKIYGTLLKLTLSDKVLTELLQEVIDCLISEKIPYTKIPANLKSHFELFRIYTEDSLRKYYDFQSPIDKCKILESDSVMLSALYQEHAKEYELRSWGYCFFYRNCSIFARILNSEQSRISNDPDCDNKYYKSNVEKFSKQLEFSKKFIPEIFIGCEYSSEGLFSNRLMLIRQCDKLVNLLDGVDEQVWDGLLYAIEYKCKNHKLNKKEKTTILTLRANLSKKERKDKLNAIIDKYFSKKDIINFEI